MKFKVGNRVEHEFYGKGTVIGFSVLSTPLVEFDNPGLSLHDGNGVEKNGTRGKDGHCWFTGRIKPIENRAVVIYPKGLETIALLKEGKKIIKQSSAKCNPTDEFDFNIGAKLAFSRLMGEEVREVKRPAKVGEWIRVTSGYGHRNGVGIFKVTGLDPNNDGWVYVNGQTRNIIRIDQYVVLENYQPKETTKTLADFTDKELINELSRRWEDRA